MTGAVVTDRAHCLIVPVQAPVETTSYFVFFNSQAVAAAAAQCSIFPEGAADAFRVCAAPGPEEVHLPPLLKALCVSCISKSVKSCRNPVS